MTEVNDKEIEAALQELLHERNSHGDGCFGCGYGGFWGADKINEHMSRYRVMVQRILEAAKPHQAQELPVSTAPPVAKRQKPEIPTIEDADELKD